MAGPAHAWLESRLSAVPAELAAEVRVLVAALPATTAEEKLSEILAAAALHALDDVTAGPWDRTTALRLLAADALLTYAFEAAAELDSDVASLADQLGVRGELGRRLSATATAGRPGDSTTRPPAGEDHS